VHAVRGRMPMQRAPVPQGVQVRDCFSRGEGLLVQIQWALEHDRQDVGGAAGLLATDLHHLAQAIPVVVASLPHQHRQAMQRLGHQLTFT